KAALHLASRLTREQICRGAQRCLRVHALMRLRSACLPSGRTRVLRLDAELRDDLSATKPLDELRHLDRKAFVEQLIVRQLLLPETGGLRFDRRTYLAWREIMQVA